MLYSLTTAIEATSFSRAYLYRAIKAGRFKTLKCGNRTFILPDELERFVAAELSSDGESEVA